MPVKIGAAGGWTKQLTKPWYRGSSPTSYAGATFTAESGFGLSGTLAEGETITITDGSSQFGTKPNGAKPLYYVELGKNSTTNGASSRTVANDFVWNTRCAIAQDQVAPNRTHSLRMTWDQPGTGYVNSGSITTSGFQIGGVADLYMFRRLRINADGTDLYIGDPDHYNLKGPRFWGPIKTGKNFHAPTYGQQDDVAGQPRVSAEYTAATEYGLNDVPSGRRAVWGLRKNEWVADEWELHQGSSDTADSTWKLVRNGLPYDFALNPFNSRPPEYPDYNTQLLLDQVQYHDDPGFQVYWWLDFVYVDDSFCRVVVSDEPTWEAGSYTGPVEYDRELQIPLTWAAGTITFELRQGMFSDFSGKYLYVVDSSGTAYKIGRFS